MVAVEQLRIDPGFVASWRKTSDRRGPGCYEIALPSSQPNPYLITECSGLYKPWFATRWDGTLLP